MHFVSTRIIEKIGAGRLLTQCKCMLKRLHVVSLLGEKLFEYLTSELENKLRTVMVKYVQ